MAVCGATVGCGWGLGSRHSQWKPVTTNWWNSFCMGPQQRETDRTTKTESFFRVWSSNLSHKPVHHSVPHHKTSPGKSRLRQSCYVSPKNDSVWGWRKEQKKKRKKHVIWTDLVLHIIIAGVWKTLYHPMSNVQEKKSKVIKKLAFLKFFGGRENWIWHCVMSASLLFLSCLLSPV